MKNDGIGRGGEDADEDEFEYSKKLKRGRIKKKNDICV